MAYTLTGTNLRLCKAIHTICSKIGTGENYEPFTREVKYIANKLLGLGKDTYNAIYDTLQAGELCALSDALKGCGCMRTYKLMFGATEKPTTTGATFKELQAQAARLRSEPADYETAALSLMDAHKIKYLHSTAIGWHIIQIVIPKKLLTIEISPAWHSRTISDAKRDKLMSECGFKTVTISGDEVGTIPAIINRYKDVPNHSRALSLAIDAVNQRRQATEAAKEGAQIRRLLA